MIKRHWFSILMFILAIASLAVGFWYGSKSKKPMYAISGVNLVPSSVGKYGNLEILSDGMPVPQVTVTNICFWNGGRETIKRSDIAKRNPIRVSNVSNVKILSCKLVKSSRNVIGAKLEEMNGNSPRVVFDFMDNNDYVLLQVLHTGKSVRDCRIAGTIIGCRHIKERQVENSKFDKHDFAIIAVLIPMPAMLLELLRREIKRSMRNKRIDNTQILVYKIVLIIYTLLIISIMIILYNQICPAIGESVLSISSEFN